MGVVCSLEVEKLAVDFGTFSLPHGLVTEGRVIKTALIFVWAFSVLQTTPAASRVVVGAGVECFTGFPLVVGTHII